MAYTMVERLAATFRHLMEIIFISSLQENITLVRTMNAKSNSSKYPERYTLGVARGSHCLPAAFTNARHGLSLRRFNMLFVLFQA